MPYVVRHPGGNIAALLKSSSSEGGEYLAPNHPDVLAFIEAEGDENDARLALEDSDADIARVTEDLVHLLVKKNVILFTDLPEMVQEKLISREKLRTKLNSRVKSIISDDETL